MKLEIISIEKKWKYIAQGWDNTVYLFASKPFIEDGGKVWKSYYQSSELFGLVLNIPGDNWMDSLYKIIHINGQVFIIKP